ncbi:MAG TPA: hypothetical protein VFV67_09020 [Actinophytocola sp.]|uniref:hypothetical protein n=1 Tax=Actinophytocola sp. TaxID=1872138 RepID=UPI002DBBAC80|nr:hypothetical protein [Actinophytocola sp.]HEU5470783.1 hypothetical protein [Actinophytocola sp.]
MTALLTPTSYTVDPWDPGYGVAVGDELDGRDSTARLELDLELPAARWRPLNPSGAVPLPAAVLFLDGVRRIDARVWVHTAEPQPIPAVAASLAVGLVCCDGAATIAGVRVDRGLYTAAAGADVDTPHAVYRYRPARPGLDALSLAVQNRLAELEVELATAWRAGSGGDDLLVVDGPLRGRTHLARTVGYVKTHHKTYLPAPQAEVVAALAPGQRSPVFGMGTSWERRSWYLRLSGGSRAPWSATVRLECAPDLPVDQVIALADATGRMLPPLASTPYKDPRAPQNLVPIGGLERELRHRLGDAALLYRSLRAALRSA